MTYQEIADEVQRLDSDYKREKERLDEEYATYRQRVRDHCGRLGHVFQLWGTSWGSSLGISSMLGPKPKYMYHCVICGASKPK